MRILGIESSCDETSVAVVENGRKILSNIIFSQEKMHRPFNGIVPEIASRSHLEKINFVLKKALLQAGLSFSKTTPPQIDAIALTTGPGLIGSLIVGKMTAEALSWVWKLPIIEVNHLEAHFYAPLLQHPNLKPPFLGLVVSGGHTELIHVKDFGVYEVLGRTRDDAAGEAFDKVAHILGIGYPGGPRIQEYAKKGDSKAFPFTRPYLKNSWDFSFSGLKTAVLYTWNKIPQNKKNKKLLCDLSASFQSTIVEVLTYKTILAAKQLGLKKVLIGGGVSANALLKKQLAEEGRKEKINIYFPLLELSTDNAGMIAGIGFYKAKQIFKTSGLNPVSSTRVHPNLPVSNWAA